MMTSSSHGSRLCWISFASAISLLVSPLIAETTTTSRCPALLNLATRFATLLIRSAVPTEVPPYFWTINAIPGSQNRGIETLARNPIRWADGLEKTRRELRNEGGRALKGGGRKFAALFLILKSKIGSPDLGPRRKLVRLPVGEDYDFARPSRICLPQSTQCRSP